MDERALGDIGFHAATIGGERNSVLHLIREKEMAIAGQVLAAKREAEETVAQARARALALARQAEVDGELLAEQREREILAGLEEAVTATVREVDEELDRVCALIDERTPRAVKMVADAALVRDV